MRLLLDTHVFLWWWSGDRKLGTASRRSIVQAREVFVSAASVWEIVIKSTLGKLRFAGSIVDAIEECHFSGLPVAANHAQAVLELPSHHSDPFDRMLIAQARVEGLTIVTHDRAFSAYPVAIALT